MWHTGLPNTDGQARESLIFTYGGPLKVASAGTTRTARWPVGSYGKKHGNFLEGAKELDERGWLNTPVRRQLFGESLSLNLRLSFSAPLMLGMQEWS